MKQTRIFLRDRSTIGWKFEHSTKWLTLCSDVVYELWDTENAIRIEVVLTDKYVAESHKLSLGSYEGGSPKLLIDNKWAPATYDQMEIVEKFIKAHKKCFIYINIIT